MNQSYRKWDQSAFALENTCMLRSSCPNTEKKLIKNDLKIHLLRNKNILTALLFSISPLPTRITNNKLTRIIYVILEQVALYDRYMVCPCGIT